MCKISEDREKLLSALDDLKNVASFYLVDQIYSKIYEDQNKHFLSLSQEEYDKISYAKCEDHIFDNNRRIKTSFEKYVRRQLEITDYALSDNNLNYLGRQLRQKLVPTEILEQNIKILSGNDIYDFYRIHTEIDSCMNGRSAYKTEIYGMNPQTISLVTYKNKSRALLWTVDDSTKILDRVYPNNCEDSSMLKLWAERKGFVTRTNNSQCSEELIPLNDGRTYSFALTHGGTFPYMDTFCYGMINGSEVELSNKRFDKCYHFQCIDGSYTEANVCYNCNDEVNAHHYNVHNGNYYCTTCFEKMFFTCYHCDIIGEFDDGCSGSDGNYYCEDCFNDRFVYCESCSEVERKNQSIEIDGSYYCHDCAAENFFLCYECEEYHSNDDMCNQDDEAYCEDCFNDKFETCSSCGTIYEKSELKTQDDELYCKECFDDTFSKCCLCENHFNIMSMTEQKDKKVYCKGCLPGPNQLLLKFE